MELIDFLILPAIFFIGFIISREDLRSKKIRNKWVLWGLVYGLGVLLILLLNSLIFKALGYNLLYFDTAVLPLSYFGQVLLNSSLSFLVVFILWKFELLPAGDAKLLFLFSFLIPLKYYWRSYFEFYPSFVLLINVFVPIFFYFFIRGIMIMGRKMYNYIFNRGWRESIYRKNKKKLFYVVAKVSGLLGMRLVRSILILMIVGGALDYFGLFFTEYYGYLLPFLFILFRVVNSVLMKAKDLKKSLFYHLLLVFLLCGIFVIHALKFGLEQSSESFLLIAQITLVLSILFMTISMIVEIYIQETGVTQVKIKDLRPGMILGGDKYVLPRIGAVDREGLTEEQQRIVSDWAKRNNLDPAKACEKIGSVNVGELTEGQIELLNEWAQNNKEVDSLEVYQKFPFALFIFGGVILTFVIKQSVIIWISNFVML